MRACVHFCVCLQSATDCITFGMRARRAVQTHQHPICAYAKCSASASIWRSMGAHASRTLTRMPTTRAHTRARNISRSIEFQYKLRIHIQRRFYLILIRTQTATSNRIASPRLAARNLCDRVTRGCTMRTFVVDTCPKGDGEQRDGVACGYAFMSDIRTPA